MRHGKKKKGRERARARGPAWSVGSGDELLVIPLGLSREVSGWWNGWIGRDPEEDEEWRQGGIDGTAPLKIRVGSLFIADGFLGMC